MGAIPELVKNSENGFLVQPGDHTRLAEKILEVNNKKIKFLSVPTEVLISLYCSMLSYK